MLRIDNNDCLIDTPLGKKRWSSIQRMMRSHDDLLASLKDVLRLIDHPDMEQHWDAEALNDSVECVTEYARNVIAKAKGASE